MCFHDLVAARVAATPEAEAVVLEEERWTYRHLDDAANRIARLLQRQGVEPETRIAICLERSPRLLAAVLGVLKAGGVYVPLDPAYTRTAEERMKYVLQDAQVSLVLTDSSQVEAISSVHRKRAGP